MTQRAIHVIPVPDGRWATQCDGEGLPRSCHETRKAAIEAGRHVAAPEGLLVVIHDETGRIRDGGGHGPHPQNRT